MAEGGLFPWKVQKIFKVPTANYERLRESLPAPPKGMEWLQDKETKEWRLVKADNDDGIERKDTGNSTVVPVPVTPDKKTSKGIPDELPPKPEVVDRIPTRSDKEEDWEMLSDRMSHNSNGVIVNRANGSVRSLTSMEDGGFSHSNCSYNTTELSLPFKIQRGVLQRTASSSTIDSQDGALGPSAKGILGVDYVEHVTLPTDTLQGICLAYKVSTTKLRQANHFSGNSLLLAPKKLVIPLSKAALRSGFIRVQDTDAKEYKLHAFLAENPDLSMTEAKAYLELADWVLDDAIRSAKADGEWEREIDSCSLRSGEIRITMNTKGGIPIGFATRGAGIQPSASSSTNKKYVPAKPIVTRDIPAITTKTVTAQDLYKASPQHDQAGVELQPLPDKSAAHPIVKADFT